jgi:hypothetical protein
MSVIQDRHGREYTVIESDLQGFLRFNIEYCGKPVGYANCRFKGDEVLHIDDIRIDDKAMRPPWFFVNVIYWTGSFPPKRWRVWLSGKVTPNGLRLSIKTKPTLKLSGR